LRNTKQQQIGLVFIWSYNVEQQGFHYSLIVFFLMSKLCSVMTYIYPGGFNHTTIASVFSAELKPLEMGVFTQIMKTLLHDVAQHQATANRIGSNLVARHCATGFSSFV
jgi:hypothetical protein